MGYWHCERGKYFSDNGGRVLYLSQEERGMASDINEIDKNRFCHCEVRNTSSELRRKGGMGGNQL